MIFVKIITLQISVLIISSSSKQSFTDVVKNSGSNFLCSGWKCRSPGDVCITIWFSGLQCLVSMECQIINCLQEILCYSSILIIICVFQVFYVANLYIDYVKNKSNIILLFWMEKSVHLGCSKQEVLILTLI